MNNLISKYLNPQNDVAFKHIFGKEKHKDILIAMLNAVLKNQLHTPIQDVQFLKTMQDPDVAASKQSIVDVLCKDQDDCQYIIEMQIAQREGFEKRAMYYASKAYIGQANQGAVYHNLKEVIFLAFTNYILFPEKAHYKSEHITLDKQTHEHDLKDISFTFVELPKFIDQCTANIAELSLEEKFFYFLYKAPAMKREDLEHLVGEDMVIQKAFDALERFSWSEEELNTYEQQEKREWDHRAIITFAKKEGLKEGHKQGVKEGIQKAMETLRKKGMLSAEAQALLSNIDQEK